jgi:hypothetical protein
MKIRTALLILLTLLVACNATYTDTSAAPSLSVADLAAACENAGTDTGMPRFARLMHDPQWMEYSSRIAAPDWPNGFYFDWYPQTVQLYLRPKGGAGRLAYSAEWLQYLRELQPNDAAAVWLARVAAGLFNKGNSFIPILNLEQLKQEPVAEGISSGGNVVLVNETKQGSGRIEMLFFRNAPPDPEKINYQTTPWLVSKFTSISIDGELGNAGGIDVYFPHLAKQKEGYWVELKRVEFFPALPFCAKTKLAVDLYDAPLGNRFANSPVGETLLIDDYAPRGSEVWGHSQFGWVRLVYLENGLPIYETSWSMETRPPILFD